MIKGIIALFTTGAILNPMVLLGIFFGFFLYFKVNIETIMNVYSHFAIYAVFAIVAFIYNAVFKKVYERGGKKIDYKEMAINTFASMAKIVIASVLSISFAYMFFSID